MQRTAILYDAMKKNQQLTVQSRNCIDWCILQAAVCTYLIVLVAARLVVVWRGSFRDVLKPVVLGAFQVFTYVCTMIVVLY